MCVVVCLREGVAPTTPHTHYTNSNRDNTTKQKTKTNLGADLLHEVHRRAVLKVAEQLDGAGVADLLHQRHLAPHLVVVALRHLGLFGFVGVWVDGCGFHGTACRRGAGGDHTHTRTKTHTP